LDGVLKRLLVGGFANVIADGEESPHLFVGDVMINSSLQTSSNLLRRNGVQISTGENAIDDG
jgi:hypothetical protein